MVGGLPATAKVSGDDCLYKEGLSAAVVPVTFNRRTGTRKEAGVF